MGIKVILIGLTAAALTIPASAEPCHIANSSSGSAPVQGDVLYQILSQTEACPNSALALRDELQNRGLDLSPTMVANRGFHNPGRGSFSIFETAAGQLGDTRLEHQHLFFGYFIGAAGSNLDVIDGRGLLVEVITWDPSKQLYNFYELLGLSNGRRQWFYRGDSADILMDLAPLHVGGAQLGNRLRCSGCHMNGGPIMKELDKPHNDWWTATRPLPLGERQPSSSLAAIMADLEEPQHLADATRNGLIALAREGSHQLPAVDMQQQLRPLFCPVEINLASAQHRLADEPGQVRIPSTFFVDPWWETADVAVSSQDYYDELKRKGSRFPETPLLDADHAWLTPVRAWSDTLKVRQLIENGNISPEFVADVLAVDFTEPLFSQARCRLLQLVPQHQEQWLEIFTDKLQASTDWAASVLHHHLTDPTETLHAHQEKVVQHLRACADNVDLALWLDILGQRRTAVFESVISSHPGGQILEPGFRVIFPEWELPLSTRKLNQDCR